MWHKMNLWRRNLVLVVTSMIFLGAVKLILFEIPEQITRPYKQMAPHTRLPYDADETKHTVFNNLLIVDDMEVMYADKEENCKYMNFLVYECGDSSCGGIGDRQKGIVSSFLLALLTNRYFVAIIKKPCSIENFLVPATHDWTKCKQHIEANRKSNETQIQTSISRFLQTIPKVNFETHWNKRIVVLPQINAYAINQIRHHKYSKQRIPWMFNRTNPEVIRMILQALFKPETRLSDELNDFIHSATNGGRKLVCSHIRVGRNPSIPMDNNFNSFRGAPNMTTIFSFLDRYHDVKKYVIYVATDSDDIRRNASERYTNFANVNRKIVHVDKFSKEEKNIACEGYYTALLEQYILSSCDVLMVTHSGFGAMASYLRGRSDDLFLFKKSNEVIPTSLTNMQKVYTFV